MVKVSLIALLLVSTPAWADSLGMPDGDTYQEVWSEALTRHWAANGKTPARDQDYFDCLVAETMTSFTPAELGRLNDFTNTRNPELQPEMNAIIANRDKRIGGDLLQYIGDKCEPLRD